MGVVEVYIILNCLQLAPTWGAAFTVEMLSVAIDALFFFVPAKAGMQEGGKVLIFSILGLDPAKGLVLGIVRRLRELTLVDGRPGRPRPPSGPQARGAAT